MSGSTRPFHRATRAGGVALALAVALTWGCSSSDRPTLQTEPTASPRPPEPDSDDTTAPRPADDQALGDSSACALLSGAVLSAVGAGDPTEDGGTDESECAIRTTRGAVRVERRDAHPDGISGSIPQYHASRRDVPLLPVGDANPPMLLAELADAVELAVFVEDATVVYRFPAGTGASPELLDAVTAAVKESPK